MKRRTRRVWAVIFFIIFICSAVAVIYMALDYQKSQKIYADSRAYFSVDGEIAAKEQLGKVRPVLRVDFAALQQVNPQVVGWLWVPNTDISYPLVQAEDNDFYLNQSYDLQSSVNGSIFVDYRNQTDFQDINTIIYGHNMNNGSMFGQLAKYREQSYAEEHQLIYVVTADTQYVYQVYSTYVGRYNGPAYIVEPEADDMQRFLDQLKSQSAVEFDITPDKQDRILTLSTCSSVGYWKRTVVHAVLLEEQQLQNFD